ncbi:uracil-DNA glycosylase [Halobacteriovorax sp. GFR7]|uniref:hypothetical protein n=1 Tax=unclassified Halobacteriovorax TaxID=2639665 RepID=UPI0018EBF04E|nr:hypothetical protein [Halobacteriovorax sp. DA5]
MKRINCMQCKYYFSTWDKDAPRGCRKFNMKSTNMPYILVRQSSGSDCSFFEQKEHLKKKKSKLDDLNDPSLW